jgi:hypothetical protein
MDNIDEIDPHAIMISTVDYPRHWKTMVQFFRVERPKEACPIILLCGENFSQDDKAKASFIGISGMLKEPLDNAEIDRLHGILGRFLPVEEKRRHRRFHIDPWQRFGFAFNHPRNETIIIGQVKDISAGGFSFLPENHSLMDDIDLNTILENCSFRSGDAIFSPACRLARTGRIVSMEFISLKEEEQAIHNQNIEKMLHGEQPAVWD